MTSIAFARYCGHRQLALYALLLLLSCLGFHAWLQQFGLALNTRKYELKAKDRAFSSDREANQLDVGSIVGEIRRLGNSSKSSREKDFRSLVCCITRNDVHLREFVVRNLLAGFGHIVIYDNNQVGQGIDYDVEEMLAPFVAQGLVTLVPWRQDQAVTGPLANDAKNDNSKECVATYGARADWVAVMDTDEVFYLQHDGSGSEESTGIGVLRGFLDDLETRSPNACGVSFPWRMMYGEHRFLKSQDLLMDTYHRVCKVHDATKLLFRPAWSNLHGMPHGMSCTNPGGVQFRTDDGAFRQLMPEYTQHSHLVHYYQKSVEEWLVKLEQSIPPYIRYIPDSYDGIKHCSAGLMQVTYTTEYEKVVRAILDELRQGQGQDDGGRFLGALPEFTKQDFTDSPEANYPLYLYCKLKVAQRQEWDEDGYLTNTPEAKTAVQAEKYVDGLQHFFDKGFSEAGRGTWIPQRPGFHDATLKENDT